MRDAFKIDRKRNSMSLAVIIYVNCPSIIPRELEVPD